MFYFNSRGVTLIELMIVIAIVTIIAAIAIPAYNGYVKEGHFTQAMTEMKTLQLEQQRLRSSCAGYADTIGSATNCAAQTIAGVASSDQFNYTIDLDASAASSTYTIIGTGKSTMAGSCACLSVTAANREGTVSSGDSANCTTFCP